MRDVFGVVSVLWALLFISQRTKGSNAITAPQDLAACLELIEQQTLTIQEFREPDPPVRDGVPRVAKLMALVIRFDQLIPNGVVADQA